MICAELSNGAVMRVHDLPGMGPPLVFLHGLGCASSSDYPAVARCASLADRRAIVVAARLGSRVRTLIASEPNLDPGGGPFSRAIAAFPEDVYVRTGHARVVQEAAAGGNHEWAGSMRVASALAVHRGAVSLVRGSAPSWRAQLVARREPCVVLFGERSLPDADYVRLPQDGVPVAVVPEAGHSMAWENPSGLADAIAANVGVDLRCASERSLS